ncbi:MAG: hypothetical protein RR052_05330, partial [Oscillospiraceae bacterium]
MPAVSVINENEKQAVTLHKVGNFYEVYGEETKPFITHLKMRGGLKTINNEKVKMISFPEKYLARFEETLKAQDVTFNMTEDVQENVAENNIEIVDEIKSENFNITDNEIGNGTKSEKFKNNIVAIEILKKCQSEKRSATNEEQQSLSKYVGWGGLDESFEETNSNYQQLKNILSEDEYNRARESTLSAFYTQPVVIKSIYKTLEPLNLQNRTILEPSCGIGNFFGLVPNEMQKNKFTGVEIDNISANIAKLIYPNVYIQNCGFENTMFDDNQFDVVIGNVPFGQFKVSDKKYDKQNFLIHDYFFAKAIDKVKPNGVIALITSKGTLDKQNPQVRKYIAQKAE